MLRHDHRPPLARLNILRNQEHAIADYVGQHIVGHLVSGPLSSFVGLLLSRVQRNFGSRQVADHVIPEFGSERWKHLSLPDEMRGSRQLLCELYQLIELLMLAP